MGTFITMGEYSYNTSFHSSIKMTPYQALYGRVPPSIILYSPGSSKVAAVDEGLVERDILVQWLGSSPKEAIWEEFFEFQTTYPSYLIEDKVNFKGEDSVTPVLQEDGQPERP
ncbi:ty3-gypsy retrotransposon protein [Tanacetum coccineum]